MTFGNAFLMSVPSNSSQLRCLVCDEVDAAKHYGSICCSGCKGFFRRSVRFHKVYECPFGKKCVIKKEFRNCCRACRFNKCLDIGLNPMLVHGDRGISKTDLCTKPVKKKEAITFPDLPISPELEKSAATSDNDNEVKPVIKQETDKSNIDVDANERVHSLPRQLSKITLKMPLGRLNFIKCADPDNPQEVWKYFGKVEQFIDDFSDAADAAHLSHGFKVELDVPLRDASMSPSKIMNRTKIDWAPKFLIEGSHLRGAWGRSIQAYFDWMSFVPEVDKLSDHDRDLLTTGRGIPSVWILFTHRSAITNAPGLLFTGGCYFPRDKKQWEHLDGISQLCGQRLSDIANVEIIDEMRSLNMSTTECALLKLLSFFMVVTSLTPEGVSIVQEARRKYTNVLTEFIKHSYPEMTFVGVVERVSRLMLLLPAIERVGQLDDDTMGMMAVFNMADMRGSLTYEMHIRKNESHKPRELSPTVAL